WHHASLSIYLTRRKFLCRIFLFQNPSKLFKEEVTYFLTVDNLVQANEHIVLAGLPTLSQFISAATGDIADGEITARREDLVSEWRTAHDHFASLQHSQEGLANFPEVLPLPRAMIDQITLQESRATRCNSAAVLEGEWMLVELDRLVVHQRAVNRTYAQALKAGLSQSPTDGEIVRLSMGIFDIAPIRTAQLSNLNFALLSES